MSKVATLITVVREMKLTLNFRKVKREISAVLNEEPLWKDLPRKSYRQRRKENIRWYLKHKEACIYYNSYGFDIVDFRDQEAYLPYRQFRIERYLEDYPKSIYQNKLCVLRDKVLFAAYFGDVLGEAYVVKTLGKLNEDGRVAVARSSKTVGLEEFLANRSQDVFVKKLYGECGDGCYLVRSGEDVQTILREAKGSAYILQNRVEQHEEINRVNPSCINTIRIITIVGKKSHEPHVFAHYMRVGCNAINDNRATGGVGVAITDDGYMQKYGVGHHKVEAIHSVTGHVYEGTKIPYWDEVKDLVVKAHRAIPEVVSIGWDVAITPNGPVLIEGNDNWEISRAQDSAGGLKKRWYELHES